MEVSNAKVRNMEVSNMTELAVGSKAIPSTRDFFHTTRHLVIVGTNGGSHDYLKDSGMRRSSQRFWRISTPTALKGTDEVPPCDGPHDTSRLPPSLCTRCFPHGRIPQRDLDECEDNEDHQELP